MSITVIIFWENFDEQRTLVYRFFFRLQALVNFCLHMFILKMLILKLRNILWLYRFTNIYRFISRINIKYVKSPFPFLCSWSCGYDRGVMFHSTLSSYSYSYVLSVTASDTLSVKKKSAESD